MARWDRFCHVWVDSSALVTLMTALGLIAAILFASSSTPVSAIVACVVVGLLGVIVAWRQVSRARSNLAREEKLFRHYLDQLWGLSDRGKEDFKELVLHGVGPFSQELELARFALREPATGSSYLNPYIAGIADRLVEELDRAKPPGSPGG